MTAHISIANELRRRRVIAGDNSSFSVCSAEVQFLLNNKKQLSINNLHPHSKGVAVGGEHNGLLFILITSKSVEWSVPFELTDACDVIIFLKLKGSKYIEAGWLTRDEIEQAPIVDNSYKILFGHDNPWDDFSLVEKCHSKDFNGIWDYETDSWECFKCGRFINDERTRTEIDSESRAFKTGENQ